MAKIARFSPMTTDRVGLALSGGGFRATAFGLGCLRALHDTGVLSKVTVVSGISGGSLLAALWAAALGVLCASASYIAVPAAMRLALPEADPGIYLTMSLSITFPFNVLVNIGLIGALAAILTGSGAAIP